MPLLGPEQIKDFGRYGAVGLEMGALVYVGVKLGQWADDHFGTTFFTLIGVLLGIAAGFYSLIKLTKRSKRDGRSPDSPMDPDPSSPKDSDSSGPTT
ncbi:MAG: hypothetical protein CMN30_06670 [Sandaracinus sp.]|nr:hypothetical protein [Sandaracinus sp.]|tara:strand:+ start:1533 stop:1823 length:291 start_codon:yes stop_codon:yes gene_type:complete